MSFDDKASEIFIKKPTVSSLTLAFSAAVVAAGAVGTGGLALVGAFLSPVTLGIASSIGAINLFRNKSGLSKVFSTASVGIGAVMVTQFMKDSSGWDGLAPVLMCVPATAAASVANLASHYTRDKGIKITDTSNNDDPSPKA